MPNEKRSRRGCVQCRSGHHKCDETTPTCRRCQTRGLTCEYIARLRWSNQVVSEPSRKGSASRRSAATREVRQRQQPSHDHDPQAQKESIEPSVATWPAVADLEAPSPCTDHLLMPSTLSPVFRQADELAAYTYYVDKLAGELQAQDGLHNPYRKLSVLALSFPVLLQTILSCAAEHMHVSGHCTIQQAIRQRSRAIQVIRAELVNWKPSCQLRSGSPSSTGQLPGDQDQALLAAVLLQPAAVAYSGTDVLSAQAYIDMASFIMNQLEYFESTSCEKVVASFIPKLLIQRFAIVDVMLSVFHRRRPRMALDIWFAQSAHDGRLDQQQPSFKDMMGCRHVAYTFLLRALHLASDVAEGCQPMAKVYEDAIDLETDFRLYLRDGMKSASEPTNIDPVTEAFGHVALLILGRRVFCEPSRSPRVQHTVAAMMRAIDSIPTTSSQDGWSGVDSASGLPFYILVRELVSDEQRLWARRKHATWRKVYLNPARVSLNRIAEKMWEEHDSFHDQNQWEARCQELEMSSGAYIV